MLLWMKSKENVQLEAMSSKCNVNKSKNKINITSLTCPPYSLCFQNLEPMMEEMKKISCFLYPQGRKKLQSLKGAKK